VNVEAHDISNSFKETTVSTRKVHWNEIATVRLTVGYSSALVELGALFVSVAVAILIIAYWCL
jgi:hypothetical protein